MKFFGRTWQKIRGKDGSDPDRPPSPRSQARLSSLAYTSPGSSQGSSPPSSTPRVRRGRHKGQLQPVYEAYKSLQGRTNLYRLTTSIEELERARSGKYLSADWLRASDVSERVHKNERRTAEKAIYRTIFYYNVRETGLGEDGSFSFEYASPDVGQDRWGHDEEDSRDDPMRLFSVVAAHGVQSSRPITHRDVYVLSVPGEKARKVSEGADSHYQFQLQAPGADMQHYVLLFCDWQDKDEKQCVISELHVSFGQLGDSTFISVMAQPKLFAQNENTRNAVLPNSSGDASSSDGLGHSASGSTVASTVSVVQASQHLVPTSSPHSPRANASPSPAFFSCGAGDALRSTVYRHFETMGPWMFSFYFLMLVVVIGLASGIPVSQVEDAHPGTFADTDDTPFVALISSLGVAIFLLGIYTLLWGHVTKWGSDVKQMEFGYDTAALAYREGGYGELDRIIGGDGYNGPPTS